MKKYISLLFRDETSKFISPGKGLPKNYEFSQN